MNLSWYYVQGVLILVGINLLTVLGLSLLTGFTGLFSFGHAGFMAIGAYVATMMTVKVGMPFIPALLVGGVAAMLFSFIIGNFTLNLKGDYFCIATLGMGEAIRLILDNVQYFGGSRGWADIPALTNLTNVLLIDIVAIVVMVFIIRSRHGRSMMAIREEELASQIAGINVFKYKMMSFGISALYAGIGGGLFAHYMTFIQPLMFHMNKSTELTIIVIFGGLGSITGSVIGTLVLVSLPEIFRDLKEWRLVFYGIAVIVIMISRPKGLMGGKELNLRFLKRWFAGRKEANV